MCSRLSLEEKIQIVLFYGKFGNFQEIIRQWKNQFTTRAPHEETIRNVVNKFKETVVFMIEKDPAARVLLLHPRSFKM